MRLSTSFSLTPCSKSGFSGPAVPATASTTLPPWTGPRSSIGGEGTPEHAQIRKRTARAARRGMRATLGASLGYVGLEPDVGDGGDEERRCQHPGRVEELALEAAPGPVAAA